MATLWFWTPAQAGLTVEGVEDVGDPDPAWDTEIACPRGSRTRRPSLLRELYFVHRYHRVGAFEEAWFR
jgi:hypothetical protein